MNFEKWLNQQIVSAPELTLKDKMILEVLPSYEELFLQWIKEAYFRGWEEGRIEASEICEAQELDTYMKVGDPRFSEFKPKIAPALKP